jgi:hypothetical protein
MLCLCPRPLHSHDEGERFIRAFTIGSNLYIFWSSRSLFYKRNRSFLSGDGDRQNRKKIAFDQVIEPFGELTAADARLSRDSVPLACAGLKSSAAIVGIGWGSDACS